MIKVTNILNFDVEYQDEIIGVVEDVFVCFRTMKIEDILIFNKINSSIRMIPNHYLGSVDEVREVLKLHEWPAPIESDYSSDFLERANLLSCRNILGAKSNTYQGEKIGTIKDIELDFNELLVRNFRIEKRKFFLTKKEVSVSGLFLDSFSKHSKSATFLAEL